MTTTFPLADQFALGRRYGVTDAPAEPASAARPFGLTLAVRPTGVATVDLAGFVYDEVRQVGLVRSGAGFVPFARHTDGATNTITDGGDGQTTNRDSDSDTRED